MVWGQGSSLGGRGADRSSLWTTVGQGMGGVRSSLWGTGGQEVRSC